MLPLTCGGGFRTKEATVIPCLSVSVVLLLFNYNRFVLVTLVSNKAHQQNDHCSVRLGYMSKSWAVLGCWTHVKSVAPRGTVFIEPKFSHLNLT